ncbi:PIR Superfamily Protein [Plasmodium ovale wallikeri]|uniref:PIR Superfamily Protein n=2 Tax=Plasmodium ovale TaxID=36330 RepID=A0A1A8ZU32_PLAOA|nr:PIR Superfamily Protein [Plasmodium ovale wallikeri]SBT56646.1 PIR Superfamily Protein [Plasmodium ovale wallikeri]SBT74190.1 Plasmodium vivax Vir protein, putative [Plasmodium ovale]
MYKNIESLPSNIFYNKLNRVDIYCRDYVTLNSIENELDKDDNIRDISANLSKILCYVSLLPSDDIFYEGRCDFLYYWLRDTLQKKLQNDTTVSSVMDKIYNELQKFNAEKKCALDNSVIDKDAFNQRKIVYDYSRNFGTIKKALDDHGRSCNTEYYNYIVNSVRVYKNVHATCITNNDTYCTNKFKEIFRNYDYQELSKLSCDLETKNLSPPAGEASSQSFSSVQMDARFSLQREDEGGVFSASGPTDSSAEILSTNKGTNTAMSIIFPVSGIFLACFTLYKFTPLWTWIHSYLMRKKYIRSNIEDREALELIEHQFETNKKNYDSAQYNVAYHAAENSLF